MNDQQTMTELDNPYWDAVREHVSEHPYRRGGPGCIDSLLGIRTGTRMPDRWEFTPRYAWTITDPASVAFVAEQIRGGLVDPLAGTGYWAYLLGQAGVDVVAYDLHPPEGGTANNWHKGHQCHAPVMQGDALDVVTVHADRTLLLSWPPYDEPTGNRTLRAYRGDRVIYIGEGPGGCCGDDAMFARFDRDWVEVAAHTPVQWFGIHDFITVYQRKQVA